MCSIVDCDGVHGVGGDWCSVSVNHTVMIADEYSAEYSAEYSDEYSADYSDVPPGPFWESSQGPLETPVCVGVCVFVCVSVRVFLSACVWLYARSGGGCDWGWSWGWCGGGGAGVCMYVGGVCATRILKITKTPSTGKNDRPFFFGINSDGQKSAKELPVHAHMSIDMSIYTKRFCD
jgi:hypothetical protein